MQVVFVNRRWHCYNAIANMNKTPKEKLKKSKKLDNVCYDIRGPVLDRAREMEEEGQRIIKLNIGNPAVFGFEVPEEIQQDVMRNITKSSGYTDSPGLFEPRKAIMHYTQSKHIEGVTVDDIIIGNGVSELIVMAMQALLNNGDQVLVPAPDYPLWTASATLAGGQARHYICEEENGWLPNLNDNHGLVIFADEIYDKMLYDGVKHISMASLADDILFVTFNGLSKNYRACGYRSGWMVVSGDKAHGSEYVEGLNMLASMRLCSNVPGQLAIQTALGGYQSIDDLVAPSGRLCKQRDLAYELLCAIPGVSCVKPSAALYLFPKLDPKVYPIEDDQQFVLDLLEEEKVLLVQGTGFNWKTSDHFRIVFLPNVDDLMVAMTRITRFLKNYRMKYGAKV